MYMFHLGLSSWQKRNIRNYKKGALDFFFLIYSKVLAVGPEVSFFHEKMEISPTEVNKTLYKPSIKEWSNKTEYQKPVGNTSWTGLIGK